MAKLLPMLLFFALSSLASEPDLVCLYIDQADTGHKKYPNMATEVDDHTKSFKVYHEQEACFDLNKNYYMQYFLWENRNVIVYGTRCRYEPKLEDEGKTLRYDGYSGSTPCPIVDEYQIDK